ncbi:fluoride efflux transporter CrcB [Sphingomonas immobilis]|uniref:Fluoride-specific ion channel FluC n=1 Tax=Sphingomonas immobilis TaxID=3063997 RepID=A0ABT9A5G0_9SPHN|nr:fluoride efflux transporter CrcB [Sphingomonas sp. CA1-15]MDO7844667.1 fluoride efflux transporter CrcB [Sphingomonas sp. CA1-15]
MTQFFLVLTGGAIGSVGRWLTGRWMLALFGPSYPAGTLAVNLVGGFCMGLLVGMLARIGGTTDNLRLFVATGLLGGYTTFSAFSLDTVTMIERGDIGAALGYVLASVIGSVLALFAGLYLVRAVA